MSLRATLTARAYASLDVAIATATPFMRQRFHPGWRVCRALRHVRDAPGGPYFAKALIASRWRCDLLFRYLMQLTRPQLRTFLEDRVAYEGSTYAQHVFNGARPVILAAPHFGAAPVGFVATVHRMSGQRALNLFFGAQCPNPRLPLLFERGGVETTALFGLPGVVSAIRALARNEHLVMMPDTFDNLACTHAVPFFGRMLRVAPGTAFFALRTNAWVVPVFASPARQLGVNVTLGRPIDPNRFATLDESQAIFMLNRVLFATFEREIRREPQHWHHWENFPGMSTAIDPPGRLEEDAPLRLLRDKCEASPHLLLDVPELELLVK
jgi:lauroyl/myristoyl acyltransferase